MLGETSTRYAVDPIFLAERLEPTFLRGVKEESAEAELQLNREKTKTTTTGERRGVNVDKEDIEIVRDSVRFS